LSSSTTSFGGHRWWFWLPAIMASLALHAVLIGVVWAPSLPPSLLTNLSVSSNEATADVSTPARADAASDQSAEPPPVAPNAARSNTSAPQEPPTVSVVPSLPSPQSQLVPSPTLNRSALPPHDRSSPKPRVVAKSPVTSRPESTGSPSVIASAPTEPSSGELVVSPAPPSGSSTQIDEASLAPEPPDQLAAPRSVSPRPLALPPLPPPPRPARAPYGVWRSQPPPPYPPPAPVPYTTWSPLAAITNYADQIFRGNGPNNSGGAAAGSTGASLAGSGPSLGGGAGSSAGGGKSGSSGGSGGGGPGGGGNGGGSGGGNGGGGGKN
jgi:hypothetical protein